MDKSLTYADAGVDIDKANLLVKNIKDIAKQTFRSGVMGDIGGFGSLFSLNTARYDRPVLVSSTDGVGTKLKLAFMSGKHDTIGIDLVAMCVNDIAVQGAAPLFFLDYISMGKLDNDVAMSIISGIGEGCKLAKCSLIGGETAEMPGIVPEDVIELSGFCIGCCEKPDLIDPTTIATGDVLIGYGSDGPHANGFSLETK